MRWFGPRWDALVCIECKQALTPVGKKCAACGKPIKVGEPIETGDRGLLIPNVYDSDEVAYHLECFITMLGLPSISRI